MNIRACQQIKQQQQQQQQQQEIYFTRSSGKN
jgi:hypothetical protein